MKKIAFLLLLAFGSLAYTHAEEPEMMYTTTSTVKNTKEMCEEVGGKSISTMSSPSMESCTINGTNIALDSLKDKYNHFVLGMMINYASEYKYSSASKWKSYLEFYAQDITDTKTFRSGTLSTDVKTKIDEELKVQESLYNFTKVKNDLGQKNATAIEKALDKVMTNFQEKDKQNVYKTVYAKLEAKIKDMEYTLTVADFTPAGYKTFMLKLNAYRYLALLINGRIE